MSDKIKIGVLGAGTWGIALARMLSMAGHLVTVWSAVESEIDLLSSTGRHPNLHGVELPKEIRYTKDIQTACHEMNIILFAVPSPFVRATAKKVRPFISENQIVVDAAKGIEEEFCFVHLDMDLYKPIKAGLEFFWPRLSRGGYIFIHDCNLNHLNFGGARQAVLEFCEEKQIGYVMLPDDYTAVLTK